MAIFDTDILGDTGAKFTSGKFHYGHHPSIIMWSNGPAPQPQDSDLFGGLSKELESLVTSEAPEIFNSFKFDAMVSEGHAAQSTVTSFPVSSGFVVSDHIINHNRVLQLTAVAVNMQNSAMWMASIQGISVAAGAIFNSPTIPLLGGLAGRRQSRKAKSYSAARTGERCSGPSNTTFALRSTTAGCWVLLIRARNATPRISHVAPLPGAGRGPGSSERVDCRRPAQGYRHGV